MRIKKSIIVGLSLTLLNVVCLAQEEGLVVNEHQGFGQNTSELSEGRYLQTNFRSTSPMDFSVSSFNQAEFNLGLEEQRTPFFENKRNLYSSMWAFASLNYIYADLIGLMDKNLLTQYQTGVVNGIEISPSFLGVAAAFMQVPLANVFLPHIIKNDKALRWVQIASGTLMTIVQAGTLFVGKPSPNYIVFSAVEIAATTFITVDALKWKPRLKKKPVKY